MRPLDFYVKRVRAVPARPVLVSASIEADDFSAIWWLMVIFEQPDDSLGWGPRWVNHEDALNGKAVLHGNEVLGRWYYSLPIASPPDDIFHSGSGIVTLPHDGSDEDETISRREPDIDGADRACAEQIARALAGALDVPVWVEPKGGPFWAWWDVLERRAAEAGDIRAQVNIASRYLENRSFGTPVEAAIWFRAAAEQGSAEAAEHLGDMYSTGRGVDEDMTTAFGWYLRAAEAGSARAQFAAASAYERGDGVATSTSEAARWYLKAAAQDYPAAQTNLGALYASGVGVEADDVEAVRWYGRAAEHGEIAAQYNLALHYENGRGVPKDLAAAARWFRGAAEGGSSWAQFKLAIACETGRGLPIDVAQALHWYRKAARAGHEQARARLKRLEP